MSQVRTLISKKILAWFAVCAFLLSATPFSVADSESNEYFESWSFELFDADGDNQNDTVLFTYDVDTNVSNYVDVMVRMMVTDNGSYVDSESEEYEIFWTDNDTFEMEWFVDDGCDEGNSCEGPFDFSFRLYEIVDGYMYYEDNFSELNISLYETTFVPDGVVQVHNGVDGDDENGLRDDIFFCAEVKDYGIENVTIELERKVGPVWVDAGSRETDDDCETEFANMTNAEYRWVATYEGSEIDYGSLFVTASTNSEENRGHIAFLTDMDDGGDFDDAAFGRFIGNETEQWNASGGVYAELFYEGNNTLYDSEVGDSSDEGLFFFDIPEGNYTFNLRNESSSGDLLQTGWMHSYGSDIDTISYWFEDQNYTKEDSNNDGVANNITITYDIDTNSQEEEEVRVTIGVYGESDYDSHYFEYKYEVTGNETDYFETGVITVEKDGNYTFQVRLVDDGWNYYDYFEFTEYLECDENYTDCNYDEWFKNWGHETESTDEDNLDDTIHIEYDPDTTCSCDIEIDVYLRVYENSTQDWVADKYSEHEIYSNETDYFTYTWTSQNSSSYDFYVYMYDEDHNWEDYFWIRNISLYEPTGAGGPEDENEYFEYIKNHVGDNDDDGYNDTIYINYEADTTCECQINISVEIKIYNSSTDESIDTIVDYYHIYSGEDEWRDEEWTPEYNGTFDFYVKLYDEDGNLEDEEEYLDVELYTKSSGGNGDEDSDEWFEDNNYEVDSKTFLANYLVQTSCECWVKIYVYIDVYNESGGKIDTISADYYIYGDNTEWEGQTWTAYENGTYDFYITLFDDSGEGPEKREDYYWVYDVYLGEDEEYSLWIDEVEINQYDYDETDVILWNVTTLYVSMMSDCDCDLEVMIRVSVLDGDGSEVAYYKESKWITDGFEDIEFDIGFKDAGYYKFQVDLNEVMDDGEYNHWDSEVIGAAVSDEWFTASFNQYDSTVDIVLTPQTNYFGGEVETYYYLAIFHKSADEEEWIMVNEQERENITITASNDHDNIYFSWTADEDGTYLFRLEMEETNNSVYLVEHIVEYEFTIISDQEPRIGDLNIVGLFEGKMFNFEVEVFGSDVDELEYTWDFGDGSPEKTGESVRFGYKDDGIYQINVTVSDGQHEIWKVFDFVVQNLAPTLEISYDQTACCDEGSTISFSAIAEDVASDEVSVRWNFPDGTDANGTYAKFTFVDDGEFIVIATAFDEDGGVTVKQIKLVINNLAPSFTEFKTPTTAEEGALLNFSVSAIDPGDDTITYTFDFGDNTAPQISQSGDVSHKYAEGKTFTIVICAKDEDGGENCRTEKLPVSLLEELEQSGLPGFGIIGAMSALGVIVILRRRTH